MCVCVCMCVCVVSGLNKRYKNKCLIDIGSKLVISKCTIVQCMARFDLQLPRSATVSQLNILILLEFNAIHG